MPTVALDIQPSESSRSAATFMSVDIQKLLTYVYRTLYLAFGKQKHSGKKLLYRLFDGIGYVEGVAVGTYALCPIGMFR
jgi:hypothetical protein